MCECLSHTLSVDTLTRTHTHSHTHTHTHTHSHTLTHTHTHSLTHTHTHSHTHTHTHTHPRKHSLTHIYIRAQEAGFPVTSSSSSTVRMRIAQPILLRALCIIEQHTETPMKEDNCLKLPWMSNYHGVKK